MSTERKYAAPNPDPESQPFWDAAKVGRFLIRHCTSCDRTHWFPRTICPMCGSGATEWQEGSGKGTVYTFTVMRRAKVPYALAYVELAEGPRMITNIVDCDLDTIEIGMPVELVFKPTEPDAPPVPCFRPA